MKKGFTLIELLAVIVILAIIALIATPIILNIINDASEESNQRSVELYADAVKNAIAKYQLNGKELTPGIYTIDELPEGFEIEVDGDTSCETIGIGENGNVYVADCKISNNAIEYTSGNKMYKNGEEVYFNVTTGKVCKASEAVSTTGTKSGCMKFYAFNDTGKNTVNLLLDHNTTATVAWTNSSTTDNKNGPIDILNTLYKDTKEWNGTEQLQNYVVNQEYAKYTIDYGVNPENSEDKTPFKARLITSEEITKITKYTSILNYYYYFDTNNSIQSTTCKIGNTSGCKYGWLYDRTSTTCKDTGCYNNSDVDFQGYWTASSHISSANFYACFISNSGSLNYNVVSNSNSYGVRPVIEVLKSKLS